MRDCIRWLETCFRTGNRFVRAQRQNEHKPIPLITYPKRKDKSSWYFFPFLPQLLVDFDWIAIKFDEASSELNWEMILG